MIRRALLAAMPATFTVPLGTGVYWHNKDDRLHDVVPDQTFHVTGTWKFRSRVRHKSDGAHSGWSPILAVPVS